MMSDELFVLLAIWAASTIILWMPRIAGQVSEYRHFTLLLTILGAASLAAPSAWASYTVLALVAVVHAVSARPMSLTASLYMVASAIAAIVAAVSLYLGQPGVAFAASCLAIALRVGLMPLHAGVSRLCESNAPLQSQQLATTIVLIVAHVRFMDHSAVAYDVAALLVRIGAVMTLIPALMALVQRDLRGFYRSATVMHGGMVFAAMGAAGRGHMAAALMMILTTAAAMTGFGLMVHALEERVGRVSMRDPGGRVHAFPKLAAAFIVFAGAGVAMPATAGFIADDLLLHALWEESVWGTATIILGSALLAIAGLSAFARIFLGTRVPSLAPDLLRSERLGAVVLLIVLLWLGVTPGVVLTPADEFFRGPTPFLGFADFR
jgi:NADH:ubiquinone oxidoreductase subunit 4 (subunit M)